ncbi:MAG: hypothetical protein ACRD8Z_04285 [Nitrososphaeraceae archaeon]
MISHKYSAVDSSIMVSGKKISSQYFFVLLVFTITIIAGMATISNLYAGSHEQSIEMSQKVFALQNEAMEIDLVINTTTLEFQDLNSNSFPDVGETSLVLGTLYAPNTQNEIGKYRASFIWGNWANSTEGAPISLGTQVFDIRENGTIVVVGDIVTDSRNGNATGLPVPIDAAIAGGTGKYQGVSGTATVTERFYEPGRALFLDVTLDIINPTSLR